MTPPLLLLLLLLPRADCQFGVGVVKYHNTKEEAFVAEKPIWLLNALIARAREASVWANVDMHMHHPEDRPFKQLRHSGVSEVDVNGTRVLLRRLLDLRAEFNLGAVVLGDRLRMGQRCSAAQTRRQQAYLRRERPLPCAEMEAYKLAHLAWPEASVFVDVGSDRGYHGALFMSLWAGGGYGVSPKALSDLYKEGQGRGRGKGQGLKESYCKPGRNRGYPLVCRQGDREADGRCNEKHPGFRLFSIDPNSEQVRTLQDEVIGHSRGDKLGDEDFRIKDKWKLFNLLVSKEEAVSGGGNTVSTTTLIKFARDNGIDESIDVLRLDMGSLADFEAIRASLSILLEYCKVGMITFSQLGKEKSNQFPAVVAEFESFGYDCYVAYFVGFIKLTGGCWPNLATVRQGNIFCASRRHAPGVVLAFDALGLGHLDDYYWPY
jgi:hypothetical protein